VNLKLLLICFFLALAVYTRSPAAYEALKGFEVIQLPSKSTLQSYTGAFMHDPGARKQCIASQVARYVYGCIDSAGKKIGK